MTIDIVALIVIAVLCGLAWWANDTLNKVPVLKSIFQVVIVVAAVVLTLQSLGLMGSLHTTLRIH